MSIDLFIPAAPKDSMKLSFVLACAERCLPDVDSVHISSPAKLYINSTYRFPVYTYADKEILDFDYNRFAFRPKWVYQQFLKLFQSVTSDWFIGLDADRFFNRVLHPFDNGKPVMFLSKRAQYHDPYFTYIKAMLGLDKAYPHSFLSECTLYNRGYINEMVASRGMTHEEWLNRTAEIESVHIVPADAELYGTYIHTHHPDLYEYKLLNDEMRGRYSGNWTPQEIAGLVNEMSSQFPDVPMFSAHSWWEP